MARRSIEETNKIRASLGLSVIPKKKPAPRKSTAILPASKKAQAQEVLATMLQSKGKKVVHKILNKALDDNDEDQMACLKLVMDRILPADYITKVKGRSNQIQINITGVGEVAAQSVEVEDVDYEEVTEDTEEDDTTEEV